MRIASQGRAREQIAASKTEHIVQLQARIGLGRGSNDRVMQNRHTKPEEGGTEVFGNRMKTSSLFSWRNANQTFAKFYDN